MLGANDHASFAIHPLIRCWPEQSTLGDNYRRTCVSQRRSKSHQVYGSTAIRMDRRVREHNRTVSYFFVRKINRRFIASPRATEQDFLHSHSVIMADGGGGRRRVAKFFGTLILG